MHGLDIIGSQMAFVGELPWHGLGNEMTPDADLEVWQKQAGLDYEYLTSPVYFQTGQTDVLTFPDKKILFRSDTHQAISVVSERYKIVQPVTVLEFFRDLIEDGGFKMHTAGVLFGGKKIWALAEIGKDLVLPGNDRIDGYLLLTTSADGSVATQAGFTTVRVVCNNTLTLAVDKGVKNRVAVRHSMTFDPDLVKVDLGLTEAIWGRFEEQARMLAQKRVTKAQEDEFLKQVFAGLNDEEEKDLIEEDETHKDAFGIRKLEERESKAVRETRRLIHDGAGSSLESASGTAWGLVNGVTAYLDHQKRATTPDRRMDRLWFGSDAGLKLKAVDVALTV